MELVYASSVAIDGGGILLRGPSGSGKSDLLLRIIEAGGKLIADDQTQLLREADRLIAGAPNRIAGQLEIRGVGIMAVPYVDRAPIALVLDMVPPEQIDRFPEFGSCTYLGVVVPCLPLTPFQSSAAAKARFALNAAGSH